MRFKLRLTNVCGCLSPYLLRELASEGLNGSFWMHCSFEYETLKMDHSHNNWMRMIWKQKHACDTTYMQFNRERSKSVHTKRRFQLNKWKQFHSYQLRHRKWNQNIEMVNCLVCFRTTKKSWVEPNWTDPSQWAYIELQSLWKLIYSLLCALFSIFSSVHSSTQYARSRSLSLLFIFYLYQINTHYKRATALHKT